MLSFKEKSAILDTFTQLQKKPISLKRVNYHFPESAFEKKIVVKHLHPNGNGYVYVGRLEDAYTSQADDKGYLSIRDFSEAALKEVVSKTITSLSPNASQDTTSTKEAVTFTSSTGEKLRLIFEHDLWNVYADDVLEMAFETREEAMEYLEEQ
ncbi:hypothetical protein [Mangrovibacillus cuniculi]|uniref:Uncharacterized protein n=1 Tax=Mangrovibacillus cuniculi TaxID=2593652 RepID=A0A7S8CD53_9BACI|nr:hypothetical protein [Mangrovibacillus cuniculi]QPC47804.1 hypothetical protein G8O30_12975 [Mangrovibacillus cuniculi]